MTTPLDAIADPVRLAMLRHLSEARRATLPELASAAGVHQNTARAHVAALEDAGLLRSEQQAASGRGRPAVDFVLSDGWSMSATDFLALAELLASALARFDVPDEELREMGSDWGRYLVGRPGRHDTVPELIEALERLGWHASYSGGKLKLRGCPCPIVSPDRPHVICDLADGVTDGVCAASGAKLRTVARDHDPELRTCALTLEETS
ncbi:MAG TPA: helix-turn-helix domain-containing protein [Thermoleophilaceae bacterium]